MTSPSPRLLLEHDYASLLNLIKLNAIHLDDHPNPGLEAEHYFLNQRLITLGLQLDQLDNYERSERIPNDHRHHRHHRP